jgi:hypothetical protein
MSTIVSPTPTALDAFADIIVTDPRLEIQSTLRHRDGSHSWIGKLTNDNGSTRSIMIVIGNAEAAS